MAQALAVRKATLGVGQPNRLAPPMANIRLRVPDGHATISKRQGTNKLGDSPRRRPGEPWCRGRRCIYNGGMHPTEGLATGRGDERLPLGRRVLLKRHVAPVT